MYDDNLDGVEPDWQGYFVAAAITAVAIFNFWPQCTKKCVPCLGYRAAPRRRVRYGR